MSEWIKQNRFYAVFIILIGNSILAFDTATIEQVKEFGVALSVGESHACALSATGVTCWGKNSLGQTNVPTLIRPIQVSVGHRHTCALDQNGVKCWGDASQTLVPRLSRPKYVSAGDQFSCAIDDSGVKCWGDKYYIPNGMPKFVSPVQVTVGSNHACALDNNSVKCWGMNTVNQLDVPRLVQPTHISAGSIETCALEARGVICWGGVNERGKRLNLVNPKSTSCGNSHICSLDDTGIVCEAEIVPQFFRPHYVTSGGGSSCAIDRAEIKCWGNNLFGHLLIPASVQESLKIKAYSFKLMQIEKSLESLADVLYLSKSKFVSGLSKLAQKFTNNEVSPNQKSQLSRLLLLYLVEPILDLTKTEFIEYEVFPMFQKSLIESSKLLGVDSISKIGLFSETFEISITTAMLALKSAHISVLSLGTKNDLDGFLAEVGSLKADFLTGYDKAQATQLFSIIQKHQSLISQLTQNKDTEAFAVVLLKIENFLGGK